MTRDTRGIDPEIFGRPVVAPEDIEAEVAAVQVRTVFERLHTSVWLTVAICLPFFWLLYPYFDGQRMQSWLAVMLLTCAARYGLWKRFAQVNPVGHDLKSWDQWFLGLSILAGAGWAYGPLMLMSAAGRVESILLLGFLLSVCAVAVIAQAARMVSAMLFLCAALVPTAWALYKTGGQVEQVAALEVLAGLFALVLVGVRSHQSIRATILSEIQLSNTVAQLKTARERAEAASVAKTRFLANMSHELRSPLNAVIGAAQLMKSGDQDLAGQTMLVDAIHQSGTNLLGLIENIMDLTRIEAGQMNLIDEPFDLSECMQAAMSTARLAGEAKGLSVTLAIDPQVPNWCRGDALRVRQLMLNLLGNAVKFTSRGEVSVKVSPALVADSVRVQVRDTGVGIPSAALASVFDAFRQADDGADRRFGGSGLGLAIVRQLVDAMGGSISVESVLGQGSCFEMILPLHAVEAPEGALRLGAMRPVAATQAQASASEVQATQRPHTDQHQDAKPPGARVLVVEDDLLNQNIVCRLLKHAGHRPEAASDGAAALAKMAQDRFDLVLMDWQMPDMDGLEVTRRLRAGEAGLHGRVVPIVALTANAFAEDRLACLDAGMNDFLSKPVQNNLLLEAVKRWAALKYDGSMAPRQPTP